MGFRSQFESLVEYSKRWRGLGDVYMVYGREAFPQESRWPAPVPDGEPVFDSASVGERIALARRFSKHIGDELPFLLDDMANSLAGAFDAYPFRVYAIDVDGRVAVRSDKGAAGFARTLERIDQWLGRASVPRGS